MGGGGPAAIDKPSRKSKHFIAQRTCQPGEEVNTARDFEAKLDAIFLPLGPRVQYSVENIRSYASGRWLARYVMAHTSWHESYCDNYRLFLSGYYKALPRETIANVDPAFVEYAQRQCYTHAQAIISILCDLLDLRADLPLFDLDLATCASQSAHIVHFIYSNASHKSAAESWKVYNRLQSCVEAVKKVFGTSPMTAIYVSSPHRVNTL